MSLAVYKFLDSKLYEVTWSWNPTFDLNNISFSFCKFCLICWFFLMTSQCEPISPLLWHTFEIEILRKNNLSFNGTAKTSNFFNINWQLRFFVGSIWDWLKDLSKEDQTTDLRMSNRLAEHSILMWSPTHQDKIIRSNFQNAKKK